MKRIINMNSSFWALISDRLQQRSQSLLIPVEFFVGIEEATSTNADQSMETSSYLDETKNIILLYQQTSDTWIDV